MMEKEKTITMEERDLTLESIQMIKTLEHVLSLKNPAIGTSAMLAILTSHFAELDMPRDEFLKVFGQSFDFYKAQIEEGRKVKQEGMENAN